MNIKARLEKFEQTTSTVTHWVWVGEGQTPDEAIADYKLARPTLPRNACIGAVGWRETEKIPL